MDQYIEALHRYFEKGELPGEEERAESVVEVLYYRYCIGRSIETLKIRAGFQQMEEILSKLSVAENDRLSDLTCDLCEQHQHAAFREGFWVGFRLLQEWNTAGK